MEATKNIKPSALKKNLNKGLTYFSKPQNVILLILGIALTFATLAPIFSVVIDTITVHVGSIDQFLSGKAEGLTLVNWWDLFAGKLSEKYLWTPLINTLVMSALSCFVALAFGGLVAYLVTRTNLKYKKYISAIFIFPYIMPQWTLAMVWKNLFNSNAVTGTANGIFASLFGICMPEWWCVGLFPSVIVLGLHYAPFAYILIGGIFRNMDANLEEAATILNTPKGKIFFRVTLPMVTPAILSTILLVFSSSMGSYPVPHYLKFSTLATKYVEMNVSRQGQASIIAVLMMAIGISILLLNQVSTSGRKSYTTVTGKSGQASLVNLGKVGKYVIAIIIIIITLFTSIYPIISFAMETFLPNPGDYSGFTTKWWMTNNIGGENGMYGEAGILFNKRIWNALKGTLIVAVCCSLIAGTIGLLVGYAVSKNRKSKWAGYVNSMAFLPYLLPSLAVGAAFFVFGTEFGLYNTYFLLILVGTIKYIPFASRSSLNSMLQLSGEIEEAAIIQNVPWYKRMFNIIIPIQKTSILSGYLLPFITSLRELTLFMMLCAQDTIITTLLDYYDEMGLAALSSGINLILIVVILVCNFGINKLTGASLDKGIGGK